MSVLIDVGDVHGGTGGFDWDSGATETELDILVDSIDIDKTSLDVYGLIGREAKIFSKISNHRPVCFVSSALSNEDTSSFDYFSELLVKLLLKFESPQYRRDVIVRVPDRNIMHNGGNSQDIILTDVLKDMHRFACIIIAPVSMPIVRNVISKYASLEKMKECPIIAIDKPLLSVKVDEQPVAIPSASADWFKGGEAAGRAAYELLDKRRVRSPRILVIQGLQGSRDRIKGFLQRLNAMSSGMTISVCVTRPIPYSRDQTIDYIDYNYGADVSGYDLIFACNDEMAMGVRESLIKKNGIPHQDSPNLTKIIGFDGTREFVKIAKLEGDKGYLYKTIDVGIDAQIEQIFRFMAQKVKGSAVWFSKAKSVS